MRASKAALLMLVIGQLGCGVRGTDAPTPLTEEAARERLLQIAKEYKSYGRVDRDVRWAPENCRAPLGPQVRFSESYDAKTHGRKLYSLFARNTRELKPGLGGSQTHLPAPGEAAPVGQAIVKESWEPEEVKETKPDGWVPPSAPGAFRLFIERDGRLYRAADKAGLFIMYKLDPATPDTDEGWVYGTVTADGQTVTSWGRVESCMKCHQSAPHDRLFGLPEEQSDANE